MAKQTILVVDTETDYLEWVVRQLTNPVTQVLTADNAEAGLRIFTREKPDLTLCDTHLAPFSGMEFLARARKHRPTATIILTSALGTTQAVIEAMKLGAYDFLRKEALPFSLKVVVDTALKAQAELKEATALKPMLTVEQRQDSIVGQSAAIQEVFKMIGRVSHSDAAVMITGESGTGKDLVARALHAFSQRSEKTFVAINCAAIPEQLLESELFGHEKGAFTGAVGQRQGRFEQCDGGTLFLDEIGDMPIALQSKILRVLQDGEFSRVGGNVTLRTNVRIIAATNKILETEVAEKRFREDLFYRLNVVRLHLPPLRARSEDVRLLAEYFIERVARDKHLPKLRLSEESLRVLEGHHWPGNVRELENTIQRACVLATSDVLLPKDIPLDAPVTAESAADPGSAITSVESAIEFLFQKAAADSTVRLLPWLEREFIQTAMKKTGNNQVRAAKLLGISRATLRKRLERHASGEPEEDGEE